MQRVSRDPFAGLRRRRHLYVALLLVVAGLALLKPAALLAIEGYQRLISPYKGYRCAYGVLYGGPSCSEFGKRAIRQYGLVGGLILLRQQFHECHDAAVRIRSGACQVTGIRAEDADECVETEEDDEDDRQHGKRTGRETREYCAGCAEGCCSGK